MFLSVQRPPSGRDHRRGMALASPNICHVCPCWYRHRLTLPWLGSQSYGHNRSPHCSMWRAAMQRTWVRLLRTQPHSCHRCCSMWPCGWHGMLLCTQPSPVVHCGLTALYAMLYVGADPAGHPHTQALGEWPLQHYQTFIPQ